MAPDIEFAYAQARLQARHGARPGEAEWRRLDATADLAGYLHGLRETVLGSWIRPLTPSSDGPGIDALLRDRWSRYVHRVAGWVPAAWRPAIDSCGSLPQLPLRSYLRRDPAPWQRFGDKEPAAGAAGDDAARPDSLDAWLDHWQQLVPDTKERHVAALAALRDTVLAHLQSMRDSEQDGDEQRSLLAQELTRCFRKFAQTPAAVFAHLGLVALDVERMRGGLQLRVLFPDREARRQ